MQDGSHTACMHAVNINNSLKLHAGWIINHNLNVPRACLFKTIRQHYAALDGCTPPSLTLSKQLASCMYRRGIMQGIPLTAWIPTYHSWTEREMPCGSNLCHTT